MATIFDTVKMVEEFSNALGQKPPTAAAPASSSVGVLLKRAAGLLGKGSFIAPLFGSNDAGAGSDVITDASTGAPLPMSGTKLTPNLVQRADVSATGTPIDPATFGSVKKEADLRTQAEADAAGQKMTADRTARVDPVIADSQAARAQDAQTTANDERMERRMMIENAIARVKAPDAKLFAGGFDTLGQLLAETGRYVSQRGQLNRLAKQEFTAQEKELDRENATSINSAKILADFRKSMKPDYKIGSVENLQGKQPVVFRDDVPVSTVTIDDKGRVTSQPVQAKPTTAQAHAEAKAAIAASSNKAFTKQQINERLKSLGYPTLP